MNALLSESLFDLDFKMDDGRTLCIRASTPMGYYILGGLSASCLLLGMPPNEARAVSTNDDLELHAPAHWVVHAALMSLPKNQQPGNES